MNILSLDIGGSKLLAASVRLDRAEARIGSVVRRDLRPNSTREQVFEALKAAVDGLGRFEFDRIGVTIPGLADPRTGTWVFASFSGIGGFPISGMLSECFGGKPVAIDNDVNACALAEKRFGACREIDNFLWVTVSNGIGGGLILNGEIYRGPFNGAAEIGHFGMVDEGGFRCGCGNFGCLEAEAAGPGIARRYVRLLRENGRDVSNNPPDAGEIAEKAKRGEKTALAVMETTGRFLGKAASYAANLLNLEAIVFGGGVMESYDLLFPPLEQSFLKHLFRSANPSIRLKKTALGYHAGLYGAAALATINE